MPLDNSNYISEMNTNNPVGSVDTVSMVDDFLREIKKTMKQSFPNINKQTTITSDELNNLKTYLKRNGTAWDMQNSPLINVQASENSTAVQPRSYNDGRYLLKVNNLGDIGNRNVALQNLMSGLDAGAGGWAQMRTNVTNMMYPVGSIYMNYSRGNNPRDFFGEGTWAAYSQGRVLIGVGQTSDTRGEVRNYGAGSSGGEYQHVLTESEMPSHNHGIALGYNGDGGNGSDSSPPYMRFPSPQTQSTGTDWRGGNAAHNNMQPFVAVYIWVRTG
ncbi:phage baseplate protein [Pantoea agglomerans]|uniref:phage baseplate protein n=1 Tax=Enterobacter agglomerans TaxID=549 RepID=UPI003BA25782